MKTSNSCNRRGCSVRILLPYYSKPSKVSSRVLQARNDTKAVLRTIKLPVDKVAQKKVA